MSELPPFELGHPRTELRRQLVAAVLSGEKTATAGLLSDYEAERENVPAEGDRFVLHDYDDKPVAVVQVTESRVVPSSQIDLEFARDEGEGFESVDDWRVAHERFFGRAIAPDTEIVALRFTVVDTPG